MKSFVLCLEDLANIWNYALQNYYGILMLNHCLIGIAKTVEIWHPPPLDLQNGSGKTYKTINKENKKPMEKPEEGSLF